MTREYTVIDALQDTPVPVPTTILLCDDPEVIGAPFYLMERVPGSPYRSVDDLTRVGRDRAHSMGDAMIDTLVAIHGVDWRAVGLVDFGRPDGFLRRQVARWKKQLDSSHSRTLAGAAELHAALEHRVPAVSQSAIAHGDYRLDNLLIDEDDRVRAVLDWEMATIGDPLLDVAVLVAYSESTKKYGAAGNANSAPLAPGYPTSDRILSRYAEQSGTELPPMDFYLGLAYFKIAAILEGVHYRFVKGLTVGPGFHEVAGRVPPLIEAGLTALGAA